MTELVLEYALGNTLLATPLVLLAWMIGRWRRHPSLAHVLWVLVMIRLVMPPIAAVPWLSVRVPLEQLMAAAGDIQRDARSRSAPSAPENGSMSGAAASAEPAVAPGRTGGIIRDDLQLATELELANACERVARADGRLRVVECIDTGRGGPGAR